MACRKTRFSGVCAAPRGGYSRTTGRAIISVCKRGMICDRGRNSPVVSQRLYISEVDPFLALVCTPIIYEIARLGKGFFARGIKISAACASSLQDARKLRRNIRKRGGGLQPLIAPSMTPLTKKRWSSGYRHRIGPEATTISAYFIVSATSSAPMPLSPAAPPCSL